jgi:hypothetical protein
MKAIAEYGAENIFLVTTSNYSSCCDSCDFTYWNNATGEFFKDSWTTAAACPSKLSYGVCFNFKTGLNEDIIDKDALLKELKKIALKSITANPQFNIKDFANAGLKVKVTGGRKWKGTGYLVDMFDKSYQYAAPRYHNRYYGTPKGFGISLTRCAKVYDPTTNEVHCVTADYIKVEDVDKMLENYINSVKSIIDNATVENLDFTDEMPTINGNKGISFIDWVINNYGNTFDLSTANDEEKNKKEAKAKAREEKFAAFKAEKMPQLIEWVKNNTDKKTEEDILKLAEHIFNKRYN